MPTDFRSGAAALMAIKARAGEVSIASLGMRRASSAGNGRDRPTAERNMFHLVSVWLTRFVVVAVLIALLVMYGPKWFAEQANNAGTPATVSSEKAPAAPGEKASPATASEQTAANPAAAASFARCQPIGRTARGELVYSMDCRQTTE
jgi:hypothetical protein